MRYYFKKQALAKIKPVNLKKLFNLKYAQLRNAIERAFGILKRQFRAIRHLLEYSLLD